MRDFSQNVAKDTGVNSPPHCPFERIACSRSCSRQRFRVSRSQACEPRCSMMECDLLSTQASICVEPPKVHGCDPMRSRRTMLGTDIASTSRRRGLPALRPSASEHPGHALPPPNIRGMVRGSVPVSVIPCCSAVAFNGNSSACVQGKRGESERPFRDWISLR